MVQNGHLDDLALYVQDSSQRGGDMCGSERVTKNINYNQIDLKIGGFLKLMSCYINFENHQTVRRFRFGVKTLIIKSNKSSHFINVLIVFKVSFYFRLSCACKYFRCPIKK